MHLAKHFLQTAEHFTLNLQDISPISEQLTFFSVLFGDDPVSDFSLNMPWAPRSALWVVDYGSLVTPVSPTPARAPRLTLWTMGYPRPKAQHITNCSVAAYTTSIPKLFQQLPSSTRSAMFFMEKTQFLISPKTCHGLRALRHGWSTAVPGSRLFLLHVHGLRARRYGVWASRGHKGRSQTNCLNAT